MDEQAPQRATTGLLLVQGASMVIFVTLFNVVPVFAVRLGATAQILGLAS